MRTYNQIIEQLTGFFKDHKLVRTFGYGTAAMLNDFSKNNVGLPLVYAQIDSIVPNENYIDFNFTFKTLDTRSKNYDNLRDIQSDTAQIMVDLRQYIRHGFECNGLWVEGGQLGTMTPLVNVTQDWLSGWQMSLTISAALIDSDCLVPVDEPCSAYVDDGYVVEGYVECQPEGFVGVLNYVVPSHLILRRDKSVPLTHDELDGNFEYLEGLIKDNESIPQTVWIDDATGDDLTGKVNDPSLPFKTIKAGVDKFTSSVAVVRIGEGNYHCPEEIFADISNKVASVTIYSKASSITADSYFVAANNAELVEFNFYGGSTNISADITTFLVEAPSLHICRIFAHTIYGKSTALQLMHPGINTVLLEGNLEAGDGEGYALSIRDSSFSDIYVRGNITGMGSNGLSNVMLVKNLYGVLNVTWGGLLDASNLIHNNAGAIQVMENNLGAIINIVGDVVDLRQTATTPVIRLSNHFTSFDFKGNITKTTGNCMTVTGNSAHPSKVYTSGKWTTGNGRLLTKSANRDVEIKMHFKDSEFTTEGFYLGGKGEYYISGNISTDKDGVLFSYPNTIPVDIHVVLDNLDFDAEATIWQDGTYSGSADFHVVGTLRSSSDLTIPSHINLSWNTNLLDGTGGASSLGELSDVSNATPTNRYVLVANGTSWVSRPITEDDISDLGNYLTKVEDDPSPKLGGDLNANGKNISNVNTIIATGARFGSGANALRAFNVKGAGLAGRISIQGATTADNPGLELTNDNNATRTLIRHAKQGTNGTRLEFYTDSDGGGIGHHLSIEEDGAIAIHSKGAASGTNLTVGLRNFGNKLQYKNLVGGWQDISGLTDIDVLNIVQTNTLLFNKGVGNDIIPLTIDQNKEITYDLHMGNKFSLSLTTNATLNTPVNDRGQTVEILVSNPSLFPLTFHSNYSVHGDDPTISQRYIVTISCWGDGRPFAVVTNQNF